MTQRVGLLSLIGPLLTGLAAIFLSLAPVLGPAPALQGPHWLLIGLYFWASRRPWSTPPTLVFALGLGFDLLRDGPIGAELFALVLVVESVRGLASRRPPYSFWAEWLRFCLAAIVFEAVTAGLLAITYAPLPSSLLIAERLLAAILLYPLASYGLQRLGGARIGEGRFAHLTF